MKADLAIRNARLLVTCAGPAPRRGVHQRELHVIPDGTIASRDGTIVYVGDDAGWRASSSSADTTLDATGRTVLPGFVDPHTHAVYAGDRRHEARRRLAGATYTEIAAEGGGILSSVQATREAAEEDLHDQSLYRLQEMLRCGTTTAEIKSGYGLTTESELKMLRVIRRLDESQPIDLVATFMGAHAVPPEYQADRPAFVDMLIRQTIPAVVRERLAEWCDVFCDEGAFSCDESRRILDAGLRAGLRPRIHADELALSGGARVAADVGARSADHLIFVDDGGRAALARAGVVATLLPVAAFYLKMGRFAPARALIQDGVPVALATDLNPGGGFSPSMSFAMTLACFGMGMTLEEALIGATINAAYALDRQDTVGSLEPGKLMDAIVVREDPMDLLRVCAEAIEVVVKRGTVVVDRRTDPRPPGPDPRRRC